MVPASCIFQARRPRTKRRAISAPKSEAGRLGVGLKKPLWIVFLLMKAKGKFMWPPTRVGGFFCYKGEIKNGRCVPSVLGEGSGILFRRCSLAKPSPQPSWAGGLGALPDAQNGGGAARPRGPGSRLARVLGGLEKERRVLWGLPPGV